MPSTPRPPSKSFSVAASSRPSSKNAPWPKKCRSCGRSSSTGPAAPSRPKPSAKKPGWRPKTTARPPAASMAKLWPRAGIGTTRRSRPDSSSSAVSRAAALARAQVAGPAGPRGLGGPFCFGGQGRDRYMAQPQRGPSARKRRRSIAIERVEADGHAQRGRQVLVDHRLGVLQGQPGQRPLAARLAVAGHVLVGRRRVAQGLRGARQSPRTASSIQLPPCGSG